MAKTSVSDEEVRGEFDRRTKKVTEDDVQKLVETEDKTKGFFQKVKRLKKFWDDACNVTSMIRAYASGEYRQVPWHTIASLAGALGYVVMPLDLIPDLLPAIGFMDDASLFGVALNFARKDIDSFLCWKAGGGEEVGADLLVSPSEAVSAGNAKEERSDEAPAAADEPAVPVKAVKAAKGSKMKVEEPKKKVEATKKKVEEPKKKAGGREKKAVAEKPTASKKKVAPEKTANKSAEPKKKDAAKKGAKGAKNLTGEQVFVNGMADMQHEDGSIVYVGEGIPDAKRRAAHKSMNVAEPADEILLLLDTTAFGSGKDGFVATSKAVYFKNMWEHPIRVAWSDVGTIELVGKQFPINGYSFNPQLGEDSTKEIDAALQRTVALADELGWRTARPQDAAAATPAQIIEDAFKDVEKGSEIFLGLNIPAKKKANAFASMKVKEDMSDISVLIDETVFGSAKEGMVLTSRAIYSKESFCDPVRVTWKAGASAKATDKTIKMGKTTVSFVMLSKEQVESVASALRAIGKKLA